MFCPECGTKVEEEAKFCPKCGFNLNESKQTENNFNISTNIETKSKSKDSLSFLDDWNEWSTAKKVISIIVVCCIGLLIIGTIGSMLSPDVNTSTDSSSPDDTSGKANRYDSYTGGSSSKVDRVEVDKMELDAQQYNYLAYDGTKDFTINGHKGHLYVGPYHEEGTDVTFFYKEGGKYYMLSACDDSDASIEKMKKMI